jgi:hypothetical protein
MNVRHVTREQTGLMGGPSYSVHMSVELNEAERNVWQRYSVYDRIDLPDRYLQIVPSGGVYLQSLVSGQK